MVRRNLLLAALVMSVGAGVCWFAPARAGVVNPDISVLGQPIAHWTNDKLDPEHGRIRFDPGETEMVFDAYLNPYAKGFFTLSLSADGLELEEGYFSLLRGLPWGLNLKGGKWRAGFGKLNPLHPHAYPFAERFRVLATYLPGEEALNETGVELSERIPMPGELALTAYADWLQGDTFRRAREASAAPDDPLATDAQADHASESRPAALGRLSMFAPLGDRSGLELGVSGTHGTNNVAAGTRTTVWGSDVKAKLWNSPNSYLLLQGEALLMHRQDAGWAEAVGYTSTSVDPFGFYAFADYNFKIRYDVGASYERYQQPTQDKTWDQAFGAFAGLALMEETTVFRLSWEHFKPGAGDVAGGGTANPDAIDTIWLRVIYSMGPHKAHQF
jgi:hypothetical protein